MDEQLREKALALKRQAIQLKRQGDLQGAKNALQQARDIEMQNIDIEQLDDPDKLKAFALYLKRQGKIPQAKEALLKSKRIQAASQHTPQPTNTPPPTSTTQPVQTPKQQQPKQSPAIPTQLLAKPARQPTTTAQPTPPKPPQQPTTTAQPTPPKPPQQPARQAPTVPPPYQLPTTAQPTAPPPYQPPPASAKQPQQAPPSIQTKPKLEQQESTGSIVDPELLAEYQALNGPSTGGENEEEDEDLLDDPELLAQYALLESGGDLDDDDFNLDDDLPVTATNPQDLADSELIEVETLIELQEVGFSIPGKEVYESRSLTYKKQAITFKKAGDLESAKQKLRLAKSIEAAWVKLEQLSSTAMSGADDELSAEFELSTEELMDPELLAEMHSIGMGGPSPEDLQQQATAKKKLALQAKKTGDMNAAKAHLREAKLLETQAQKFAQILSRSDSGDEGEFDEEALERALLSDGQPSKPSKEAPNAPPPKQKSAEELKAEAFAFRKENKLKEAAQAFREYKAALEMEEKAATQEETNKLIALLEENIEKANTQLGYFEFYSFLGHDPELGTQQCKKWTAYINSLREAQKFAKENSHKAVSVQHTVPPKCDLLQLEGLNFIGDDVESTDLCLAIKSISGLDANKKITDDTQVKIKFIVHLPPSEDDTDSNIEGYFDPILPSDIKRGNVSVLCEKTVQIPRGDSRFAKMVRRRMGRKKMELQVLVLPLETGGGKDSSKSGYSLWGFRGKSSSSSQEAAAEGDVVGRVVFQLEPLVADTNYIAGEFALMDRLNKKAVGGSIAFAARTSKPYDPDSPRSLVTSKPRAAEDILTIKRVDNNN